LHRLLRPVVAGIESLLAPEASALRAAFAIGDAPPGDPLLVALATLELLSAHADDCPVVVVADDFHWLDSASRDVLAFVGRRIEHDPIVVLAALRDCYPEGIGELGIPQLALAGLERDHAAELLDRRATGLSAGAKERLLTEAAGNPLALVELPATPTADAVATTTDGGILPISAQLERAFAARVRDVPADTAALLLIAAADEVGRIDEILAAGEITLGHAVSDASLKPAIDTGLITPVADSVLFGHPLVRAAVYQSADLERRREAHAALTKVLADDPDRRAWHRAQATMGCDEDVAQEVEAMAWRAQDRGSVTQAALLLGRAAELTTKTDLRGQRLLRAGELAFQLGRVDLVEGYVRDAQRLDLGSREAARVELLSEAFYDGVAGDVDRVRSLAAIARQVSRDGDVDLALELLKGASLRCWRYAMGPAVRGDVLAACDELTLDPRDPRVLAIVAIVSPFEREAEVSRRVARSIEAASGDPPMGQLLGIAAHAVGDHDTAARILVPVADAMRDDGRLGLLAQVQSMLQWDAIMLGEWSLAAQVAKEGDRLARDTGQRVWGAGLTCGLAVVAAIHGEEERAEELAAEAESVIIPHGLVDMHTVLLTARGIAALSARRYEHAYRVLSRVLDPLDPCHHYREQFGAVTFLADAAVMCRREADARATVERLSSLAAPSTAPPLQFGLRYARAVLATDDAAEALHTELLGSDLGATEFDRARLFLSYGMFLRRNHRDREARDMLKRARRWFDAIGARSWADRAHRELVVAGPTAVGC
jgi:hypothetical protein